MLIPPERLDGWIERFGLRHGEVVESRDGCSRTLTAADGAVASFVDSPRLETFGLLLVRRGGYAVGLVRAASLVAHKSGTRYVQGQTKAGGWSQQRYAHRRANQAADLVRSCASHADRILAGSDAIAVFGGGDRSVVDAVITHLRVRVVLQDRWLDVPDPRHQVLLDAVPRARSYQISLNDLA